MECKGSIFWCGKGASASWEKQSHMHFEQMFSAWCLNFQKQTESESRSKGGKRWQNKIIVKIEQLITSHKRWINLEVNIDKQEILLGNKDEVTCEMGTLSCISLPLDFIWSRSLMSV